MHRRVTVFLFLLAPCVLRLAPSAWAADYYVNDCCTTGDVYTTAVGSGATGCGAISAAAPQRSIDYIFQNCAIGSGDRIFVDTGVYFSRRYDIACSCSDGACGNACATNPDRDAAPHNDDGGAAVDLSAVIDGNARVLTFAPNGISIIGVPSGPLTTGNNARWTKLDNRIPDGGTNTYVIILDNDDGVRIANFKVRQSSGNGIIVRNDSDNNVLENLMSNSHGGGGGMGIEITAGAAGGSDGNIVRNSFFKRNNVAGVRVMGSANCTISNNTFVENTRDVYIGETGGVESGTVTLRNNLFRVRTGGRIAIEVDNGSEVGFSSNFNRFYNTDAASDIGRWLSGGGVNITADTLSEWECVTDGGANGCVGACPGGGCGGAADCCQDANSTESAAPANEFLDDTDPADQNWFIRTQYGRYDPAREVFRLGDDLDSPLAYDTGTGTPADPNFSELESNANVIDLGGYGNTFRTGRRGPGSGLVYVGASCQFCTDSACATCVACGAANTPRAGDKRNFSVQIQNNGNNILSLGRLTRGAGELYPTYCRLAAATDPVPLNTVFRIEGTSSTGAAVSHRAYLTSMTVGGVTDYCMDPTETATLCLTSYVPISSSFCDGSYRAFVLVQGDFLEAHRADVNVAAVTLTPLLDYVRTSTTMDGRVPFPNQVIAVTDDIDLQGDVFNCSAVGRPAPIAGSFTPVAITADAGADTLTLDIRNRGGAAITYVDDATCDASATDSYIELREADTDLEATFSYRVCVNTTTGGDLTTAAGVTDTVTFSTGAADVNATNTDCNGPNVVSVRLNIGGTNNTPVIADLPWIIDSTIENCEWGRPRHLRSAADPAVVAGGGADSFTLDFANIGTDDVNIRDEPANSYTQLVVTDGQGNSQGLNCGPDSDCNNAGANPVASNETVTLTFDDQTNGNSTLQTIDFPATWCNGDNELRMDATASGGFNSYFRGLDANDVVADDDIVQIMEIGNKLTLTGGVHCFSYLAGTLEKLDAVADTTVGDGILSIEQSELGVQIRLEVLNTGTASVCLDADGGEITQFRVCDDGSTCAGGNDYAGLIQTVDTDSQASTTCNDGGDCPGDAGCTVLAGERAVLTFLATNFPALPGADYTGTDPDCFISFAQANVRATESCTPDIVRVTPISQGIGDKVTESGWIEVER